MGTLQQHLTRRLSKASSLIAATVLLSGVLILAQEAGPKLTLKMTAAKEVREVENGKEVVKRVPVKTTSGGDVLVYTIEYVNDGTAKATEAAVIGPIPEGTVYVLNSAAGKGVQTVFSIDGGRSYLAPPVTYTLRNADGTMVKKPAPAEMYTHVRWLVPAGVIPGGRGDVTYKVRVK